MNQCCKQNIPNDAKCQKIKRKYEMLQTIITDSRAPQYNNHTAISFRNGDENVRATGFFKYENNILNISMKEIERMGQWLRDNPNTDISQEFYGIDIGTIIYQMKYIKEKCKISKMPLNIIKKAYESIKNVVLKPKENTKMQEECVRNG